MKNKSTERSVRHAKDKLMFFKAFCVIVQLGLYILGWEFMQEQIKFFAQTSILLYFIYFVILFWMHETYGSFKVGKNKLLNLFTAHLLTLLISDGLIFLISILSIRHVPNILMFLLVFALQLLFSGFWCFWANKLYSFLMPVKRIALIYQTDEELDSFRTICNSRKKYKEVLTVCATSVENNLEEFFSRLEGIESVFIGSLSSEIRNELMNFCLDHHITIDLWPTLEDVMISIARRRFLTNGPMLEVGLKNISLPIRIIKRTMDLLASGLLLILSSPVMAVIAILIRAEDHGPAIYRQKRLTIGGKVFEILKFRSMRVDAEKDGVPRLASEKDSRITQIGHFIRATRLDELPQLWNIFKGDMSLVGPRPERPEIAAQYLAELPQFNARLQVKAGLTGYAQVNGKYNTTPKNKLLMDMMYISEISIPLDVKLILQTIHIMLKKESTEGIQEGKTTALKS